MSHSREEENIYAKIGHWAFGQNRDQEINLCDRLFHDRDLRNLLNFWLQKQGLPQKNVSSALPKSVATAYCNRSYLIGWRNKINPSWALLNPSEDGDLNDLPELTPTPAPTTSPSANTQSEAWLKDLFVQIDKMVKQGIETKLDLARLKLDDSAKDEIRALATTAAQNKIAELMPPRTIEVRNLANNLTVNVGLQHEKFPLLLKAINARDHRNFRLNIWLTGPTGSGKTSAAEAAAKALGLPFGSDGSLDADYKVLGFRDANGNIISTQFLDIYENGGIYVADEIDNWMPSALLSLNAALANGWVSSPKGMIKRHPNACVIACANTWGLGATSDYVGRTKLDAASLDRFHPKIDWPYDLRLEKAIATQQGGELGQHWHDLIVKTRAKVKDQGLKIIVSPRATFNGIALLKSDFSWQEVIDMTIAPGLSPEQKRAIGIDSVRAPNLDYSQVSTRSDYSKANFNQPYGEAERPNLRHSLEPQREVESLL